MERSDTARPGRAAPRVLVLGATGMLGHKLVQVLGGRGHTVIGTIRGDSIPDTPAARAALAGASEILTDVDVLDEGALAQAFQKAAPDLVVNAIGLIKQLELARDPISSITVNSLLPHRIAKLCVEGGARLVHLSTDCVFAGRHGPFAEDSPTDAEDLYGRSKLLGEVSGPRCLTLRSSIVGRELRGRSGLIEWFLSMRGRQVKGYAGALYTGMTTITMAELIGTIATEHPDLEGIWHVASPAISKYDLLASVNRHFDLGIELLRDETFAIDRRLDGSRFRERTGFRTPSWDEMIAAMRADPIPYDA